MNDHELVLQAHINNLKNIVSEKESRLFHISNKNCIQYQIIKKTLDIFLPFFNSENNWLSVGDFNGLEANYLEEHGQIATASDVSDVMLFEAHEKGLIKNYCTLNVENIQFADNSFDYVICKEAFHHFQKAYLGLYEMIRCSKKATILIEPIDILSKMPLLLLVKNVLDRINPLLVNKIWKNRFSFETVGNYVFKISEREVEKIAMGLGFSMIAFKRLNFVNSNLDLSILQQVPINEKGWKKILVKIKLRNLLSSLHIIPYNHLCSIVFKVRPDQILIDDLKKLNYTIIELPSNPYI